MKAKLEAPNLEQLFTEARTFNKFTPKEVDDDTISALYNLLKWGPTAVNCQPGRYVFVRSAEAKKRLLPCLSPGNVPKVENAPVTVIMAYDTKFYDYLPEQWTAYDAAAPYLQDPALAASTAFRNGSLEGAYLILAARALGLDCGPMSGFDNAKVDAEFFPDGRFKSNFLINVGYGLEGGYYPRGPRLSFETVAKIL
ncbi:MAG: malonic semialdehyde reductase [Deltaproteobacteria bacterium]|jgi:3-hydroxypropanoate dehydrogenase|nr:malonic semialdehyde reductase [Deltaproteobacteria bacterium]